MTKLLIALIMALLSGTALADGSVSFQDHIVPILAKQPMLEKLVLESFTVTGSAMGIRIGNAVAPGLGGARIGPYHMPVIWHSPKGDVKAMLIINTSKTFYDKHGHELGDDISSAFRVSEAAESISLEPLP